MIDLEGGAGEGDRQTKETLAADRQAIIKDMTARFTKNISDKITKNIERSGLVADVDHGEVLSKDITEPITQSFNHFLSELYLIDQIQKNIALAGMSQAF